MCTLVNFEKSTYTFYSSTQRKNQKITSTSPNPLIHFQTFSSTKVDFHPLRLISNYLLFVWLLACGIVQCFSFSIVPDCLNILKFIFPLDYCCTVKGQSLSHVGLSVTPWTVACQAFLSMRLSRQEHWSGLPIPSPLMNNRVIQNPGLNIQQCYEHILHTFGVHTCWLIYYAFMHFNKY